MVDVVLVTYNPDMEMLRKCISSIEFQVRKIWIVDNHSTECNIGSDLVGISSKLELIQLSENKGIAYAQNIGMTKSIDNYSDYIILSDQDTFFPDNYVTEMLSLFDKKSQNVVAIAPLFHDSVGRNKNEGFIVPTRFGFSRIYPNTGCHIIHQAISSGLIIKTPTLNTVGLMKTDLFIDWVDCEWCWRAIAYGYLILGNADVLIEHNLGDKSISVGGKGRTLRNPTRHYYTTRNAIYLALRCPYLNIGLRLVLIYKGILYIIGYAILAKPRVMNLKMTLLGFYHGVIGRLGRLG